MKIAISGMGLRAGHVLAIMKANMPEIEFTGYVDPQTTYLGAIGGEDLPQFDTVPEMLAAQTPDILWVSSPNHMHLDDIRAGLEAGVRIFTEKPVVTSIEDTFALAELLAEYGAENVMVGLVLRYSQHMRDLRTAIAAGHIGQIASIEANEHIAPYHGAFFMRDWRRNSAVSGGFMLEKCCHDLDIYNMVTGSRPAQVASFGGRRSFLPEHAPARGSNTDVYHVKGSIWDSIDDPFTSDGDIVDHQTAILKYENGISMCFHTNINTPDEQRRFCVIGAKGMAEGDFVRGYLKVTDALSRDTVAEYDYSGDTKLKGAHYGADEMMCDDIISYLRGETDSLPVSILDALEAGIAALALDEARAKAQVVDLTPYWEKLDAYGLR